MDKYIYGADTETVNGRPNSLQFYSEDIVCDEIHFVNDKTAASTFLRWCSKRRANAIHVVYVHNLAFDLPEFFWGQHAQLVADGSDYKFTSGEWTISGVYGTPTFCRLSNGHNKQILLVDSFSFYRGSLAEAAKWFCPDLPKLKKPAQLGEIRRTAKDSQFVEYAMRDAVIDYHIGKALEKLHVEYDIQQTVSVADMAAKIFRHKFLSYTIPQPSRDVIECALLSYHGGKNNVTVAPGWYEKVTSIDISSAYPDALQRMPAFSNGRLYKRYSGKSVTHVPDYGVYFVSGRVRQCKWPSVFSHAFKPLSGAIERVAMQGFELNEALRSKELKATKIRGWCYDRDKDHQAPALRGFVDDFYAQKERERDPTMRMMKKFILNSISGKLIQTRKRNTCAYTDIDADVTVNASELVAGGMFHPFIASACTADPRAAMHRYEHQYRALHTATDGIFTQSKRLPKGPKKLGSFSVDAKGTLLLIRNKCYILYSDDGEIESKAFIGKRIKKYAKHGFQGTVFDLERLVATGKRTYKVNTPYKLKEALKGGHTPNEFRVKNMVLKVPPLVLG